MSIINEALKKAESDRQRTVDSPEFLEKILGPSKPADGLPVRKQVIIDRMHRRIEQGTAEAAGITAGHAQPVREKPDSGRTAQPRRRNWKAYAAVGSIFVSALFVITIHFLLSSKPYDITSIPLADVSAGGEAPAPEPYTEARPETAKAERWTNIFSRSPEAEAEIAAESFLSEAKLTGIVADGADSWAIIDDDIHRVGDSIREAEIVGIEHDKVILSLNGKVFDMWLK